MEFGNSNLSLRKIFGELFTPDEVAQYLLVSRSTVCAMARDLNGDDKYREGEDLHRVYSANNKVYITEKSVGKYLKCKDPRNPGNDRIIIKNTKMSLLILGINGLGPLHQNREIMINLLMNGGKVRVLLLDPSCEEFRKRVEFEKCKAKQITSRLLFEFLSSYALCKEIHDCSAGNCDFQLRVHSYEPKMSLVICDSELDEGILNQNIYPPTKGMRGMEGAQIELRKSQEKSTKHFEDLVNGYWEQFNAAKPIDLERDLDLSEVSLKFQGKRLTL